MVYTTVYGDNCDLVAHVAQLYLQPGLRIADVTWGKGVFWRQIDLSLYDFHPSDMVTCDNKYDFRDLPYDDATFDVVVLDPPYRHDPGKTCMCEGNYQNHATTGHLDHAGIIQLYRDGMTEARRILRPGGLLWVKTQDEIESGRQRRSTIEVFSIAVNELGFIDQDRFTLVQKNRPLVQFKQQRHARKNESCLWIFKKKG